MAPYTAGEFKKLFYVAESVYGTTPASALSWGADCETLKGRINRHQQFHLLESSRSFGSVTNEMWDAGFHVKAIARLVSGGYDWRQFWAKYAFGSTTGLADHLDSFTAQTGKIVGGVNKYNFYNGCKINKLTMQSENPGAPIFFDADVFARWITATNNTKVLSGLQSVTVGSDPTNITTAILTWLGAIQINIAGGGLVTIHPKNWKLTVENHLQRHHGILTGADSQKYPVTFSVNEDVRDIVLEAQMLHEDETYTNARLADSTITELRIPVDTYTISLTGGTILLEDDDWPEYKQGIMEEQLRVKFKSLSIS